MRCDNVLIKIALWITGICGRFCITFYAFITPGRTELPLFAGTFWHILKSFGKYRGIHIF